jgi:hypothetical protein
MKLFRAALVVAVAAAAGCKGNSGEAGANAPAAPIDTTNDSQWDGSSTQQVQQQAEALTPEQAAQRGLVDTTIHLENLSSSDSTPPGATLPNPANPGGQTATRTDTVAPRPETNPTAEPPSQPKGAPTRP